MGTARAVKELIETEAKYFGFEKLLFHETRAGLFSVDTVCYNVKTDGKYEQTFETDDKTLHIGILYFNELEKKYEFVPEVVKSVVHSGIRHEKSHTEKLAAAHKLMKRQVKRAIEKYGVEKFGLLDKDEADEFVKNAVYSKAAEVERDFQADIQALVGALNEPGINVEKMKEEIAADMWLRKEPIIEELTAKVLQEYGALGYLINESFRKEVRLELQRRVWNFDFDSYFKGLNCKGDVIEKAKKIDEKYRSKLK